MSDIISKLIKLRHPNENYAERTKAKCKKLARSAQLGGQVGVLISEREEEEEVWPHSRISGIVDAPGPSPQLLQQSRLELRGDRNDPG